MGQPALAWTSDARAPLLWRAADVAALYGVDESTVHRWERSGRIRASRRDPGGTKYWVRDEIIADATSPTTSRGGALTSVEQLVTATRRPRRRR